MIFDTLTQKISEKKNPTCVGLDTQKGHVPEEIAQKYDMNTLSGAAEAIVEYNRALIEALCEFVPAVKIQVAYYETLGVTGMQAFVKTLQMAKQAGLITIADCKRNDIASTAGAYAAAYLAENAPMEVDLLTINPYLGEDGVLPFLQANSEKGVFALVKTSNPSSADVQDMRLADGRTVYEAVGDLVETWGEANRGACGYSNCGAVVGATHPAQGALLRKRLPHTFFLLPGYGAQGATAKDIVGMFDEKGGGAIVNNSRGILAAWQKTGLPAVQAATDAAKRMQEDLAAQLAL